MVAKGNRTGFGDEWIRFGATAEHTCRTAPFPSAPWRSACLPGVEPPYQGNVTTRRPI